MGDRVETLARLAQWKIDNFGPCSYKKSDPFKLGIWNWYFSTVRNKYLYIHLFPEPSQVLKDNPPFSRFVLRVSAASYFPCGLVIGEDWLLHAIGEITFVHCCLLCDCYWGMHPKRDGRVTISVQEKLLRTHDDFVWPVDTTFVGRLIIDVEFLDLKICPPNGGETSSVWPSDGNSQSIAFQNSTLRCLSRMLDEAIHADLTIMTADGSTLRAHKAVLSASSPVFQSMYHLNLKEK
ncbi:BTB/POZ domain-containing protein [Glycine soja]|uniref:BTB/POZ domain-containing protein n=1 Tax=Glycine soja TaxID=3848 RepID=A0A0B2RLQ4_GLYSO|nr:BTB/POZ domain-containing protein [Glycine soja]